MIEIISLDKKAKKLLRQINEAAEKLIEYGYHKEVLDRVREIRRLAYEIERLEGHRIERIWEFEIY